MGSPTERPRAAMCHRCERTSFTALVLLVCAMPPGAVGQNQNGRNRDEDTPLIEEVLVTARKRVESLQSVPVSAAVVSGATIQDHAIVSLQDLSTTLPAIQLSRGSTTDRMFVRGIGSGDNPSFEQSVGSFVDDVYHGRARLSQAGIFDVERVEVLKGPQTTYFGNNAIAGAINVTSRSPSRDFGGELRAMYNEEFESYLFEGAVDQPLGDTLSVRIAALTSAAEGWITDIAAGENAPETKSVAARATLLWEPSDAFSAKLKVQYADEQQRGGLPIVRQDCPPAAEFGSARGFCASAIASSAGPASSWFTRSSSSGQRSDLQTREAVGTLSYSFGAATFTSVSAYTNYDYALKTDLDTLPATLFAVSAPEEYEQWSQELRLDTQGDRFDYLVGVYYQGNRLQVQNDFNYAFLSANISSSSPLAPYLPVGQSTRFTSDDELISGFGALTWKVTPDLRGTLAVRYSQVEKDFHQRVAFGTASSAYGPVTPFPDAIAPIGEAVARAGGLGVPGQIQLSRKDDRISPSLSVEYDTSERSMMYARYDHGFKAGGFNGVDAMGDPSVLDFAPEKVDAYELGVKTRWLGGRITFNADVFRAEYEDLQVAGVVPSTGGAYVNRVQNAGAAVSQGVELELAWEIDSQWRSMLSLTALDAKYTRYPNATPTAAQSLAGQRFQDLSGEPILFAPDYAGQWTLSWSREIRSGLELSISNLVYASSSYFLGFSNDPYLKQPGYWRDDLTIGLSSANGWDISLIGKNLSNELIRTYGATLPASLGSNVFITEPPRSVAIQIKYGF